MPRNHHPRVRSEAAPIDAGCCGVACRSACAVARLRQVTFGMDDRVPIAALSNPEVAAHCEPAHFAVRRLALDIGRPAKVLQIWSPIPLPQALRNEHIQALPWTIRDVEGALHVLDLMHELEYGAGDPARARFDPELA
jgi:hypothetical protein